MEFALNCLMANDSYPDVVGVFVVCSVTHLFVGSFFAGVQPIMLQRMLLIGFAGAIGTLARYGLGGLVQRVSGNDFPIGTLFVNMLGCFLFGMVWALSDERLLISQETRVIMLGGFMGAFTTFSTFIFDTGGFLRDEQYILATGNILVQTAIGLLCFFSGIVVGRWI